MQSTWDSKFFCLQFFFFYYLYPWRECQWFQQILTKKKVKGSGFFHFFFYDNVNVSLALTVIRTKIWFCQQWKTHKKGFQKLYDFQTTCMKKLKKQLLGLWSSSLFCIFLFSLALSFHWRLCCVCRHLCIWWVLTLRMSSAHSSNLVTCMGDWET